VLDMESSVSPTYGDQEGTAYNGHFACTCYHPLFVFKNAGRHCAAHLWLPGNPSVCYRPHCSGVHLGNVEWFIYLNAGELEMQDCSPPKNERAKSKSE
jgi:hypothetical protein